MKKSIASSSIQTNMNFQNDPHFSPNIAYNQTYMTSLKPSNRILATSSAAIGVDELLSEIMIRLPLYSIQRFNFANKQWHSVINDSTLRKQWRKHNLKPPTGLILLTRAPMSIRFLSFSSNNPITIPTFKPKTKIKQFCNGLLLCLTNKRYHVYNPTTDKYHYLPDIHLLPSTRIISMNLAYDPNRLGPRFKVICCVSLEDSKCMLHVHTYSSDTRVWMWIVDFEYTRFVNIENGVYWNGSINWMHELTYFDIEKETFNVIPQPPAGSKWRTYSFFGESCDRLNIAKLHKPKGQVPGGSVDVYELKRDYSEWVLKYCVKLDCLPNVVIGVISVIHGLEEDDSFLLLKTRENWPLTGVMRYYLASGRFEVKPDYFTGECVYSSFQYIESHCHV